MLLVNCLYRFSCVLVYILARYVTYQPLGNHTIPTLITLAVLMSIFSVCDAFKIELINLSSEIHVFLCCLQFFTPHLLVNLEQNFHYGKFLYSLLWCHKLYTVLFCRNTVCTDIILSISLACLKLSYSFKTTNF